MSTSPGESRGAWYARIALSLGQDNPCDIGREILACAVGLADDFGEHGCSDVPGLVLIDDGPVMRPAIVEVSRG